MVKRMIPGDEEIQSQAEDLPENLEAQNDDIHQYQGNAPSDRELLLIASQLEIGPENVFLLQKVMDIVTDIKFEYPEWKFRQINGQMYWACDNITTMVYPFLDQIKRQLEQFMSEDIVLKQNATKRARSTEPEIERQRQEISDGFVFNKIVEQEQKK